jgi:hypothetical protein
MKILKTKLRAIIERSTEIEWHSKGAKIRLFVFEQLGEDGKPCLGRIQNWECDDVTNQFNRGEVTEIFEAVNEYWKTNS